MSTRDHYSDIPHTLPDEVRDGRQLMAQDVQPEDVFSNNEHVDPWDQGFGIFGEDEA